MPFSCGSTQIEKINIGRAAASSSSSSVSIDTLCVCVCVAALKEYGVRVNRVHVRVVEGYISCCTFRPGGRHDED